MLATMISFMRLSLSVSMAAAFKYGDTGAATEPMT